MALDEALLQSATAGTASLRFYGWSEATASLGYFQAARVRLNDSRVAVLPFVRRPSGGATLVHHHEVTYCLGLPPGAPWQSGAPWLTRMHRIIAEALAELGIRCRLHQGKAERGGFLCFQQFTAGDLLIGPAKVVGSAQRKQRGALLQHGAILLAGSLHTPGLPGIRELSGVALTPAQTSEAILHLFARQEQVAMVEASWTAAELAVSAEKLTRRYSQDAWNCKR